jgi:hypothetical protein
VLNIVERLKEIQQEKKRHQSLVIITLYVIGNPKKTRLVRTEQPIPINEPDHLVTHYNLQSL